MDNTIATENFIDFCDGMMIANEESAYVVNTTPFDRSKAKKAMNEKQAYALMREKYPLIEMKNKKLADKIKRKEITKMAINFAMFFSFIGAVPAMINMLNNYASYYTIKRDPDNPEIFLFLHREYHIDRRK